MATSALTFPFRGSALLVDPQILPGNPELLCPISSCPDELLLLIFHHLPDLKEVPKIELVCKIFKRVSEDDSLWKLRLKSIFSSIHPLDPSNLSIKLQTKTYILAYRCELMQLEIKKNLFKSRVSVLRGSNGLNGLIHKAWEYQQMAQEESKKSHTPDCPSIDFVRLAKDLYSPESQKLTTNIPYVIDYEMVCSNPSLFFSTKFRQLKGELSRLVGPLYDGAEESIELNSALGQIERAIKGLKSEYDTQSKFHTFFAQAHS